MRILRLLTVLLLFIAAPSNAGPGHGSRQPYVVCDEWPPYQVIENNRVRGFSTIIVETIFTKMQVIAPVIEAYPWKRAIIMIEKGAADALFSANYTKERAAFAFYPEEPIINAPWVMWAREEDGLQFQSFSDLIGKKIGLVRGYSYTSELWNFVKKHCSYEEVTNDEINFAKLNAGRVDLIPAELGNGLHIAKKLKLNKIIPLADNPLKTDGLYIIFNKQKISRDFVVRFSKELKKLKQETLYQYLNREYFGF